MKRDFKVKTIAACAIDTGYFNVKYTSGRKSEGGDAEIDCGMFTAVAPVVSAHQLMHASGAPEAKTCIVNVRGVNYMVGDGATAFTKGNEPRTVEPDYCMTDKYYALMLGAMNKIADHAGAAHELVIDSLGVGLPLNTYGLYSKALAETIVGEHCIGSTADGVMRRVTVSHAHVMVQPHGALLNFGARSKVEGAILVIDPGGGTLDWFLMDENRAVAWPRCGAYPVAMLHVAQAIADQIEDGLRNEIAAMNAIDKALRLREPTFKIGTRTYELQAFRATVDAVLEQSVKAMFDRTGSLRTVQRILLTGGGAALFRSYLDAKYPGLKDAIEMDVDPVYSNVRGFQIAAEHVAETRGAYG